MAVSDLKRRILTAAVLLAVILFIFWIDGVFLPVFMLVFFTFAGNEYLGFWRRKQIYPQPFAMFLPVYVMIVLVHYGTPLALPILTLFIIVCSIHIVRFPGIDSAQNFLTGVAASSFGAIYLSILPVTVILLRKISLELCLMPFILTWLYDTFAYFVGSAIGKHKLAPRISPKKTWEGTLFAFPLTFLFTLLLSRLWHADFSTIDSIVITTGIGIFATMGDLFESGMKRGVGLKDASNAFPGHGGFLDRIDSLILSIPFFYVYLMATS